MEQKNERNIIVTVLSTLPKGVSVVENIDEVEKHKYIGIINEKEYLFEGRSQLEAGTKYYLKKGQCAEKYINEIIIIGSKETICGTNFEDRFQQKEKTRGDIVCDDGDYFSKLQNYFCDNNSKDALDVYLYGVKEYCIAEDIKNYNDINLVFVPQDKNGLLNSEDIKNAILKENLKTNVFLDIQGGNRITSNIIFNLINTLKIIDENIELSQIISINFDPTDRIKPSEIVDETDNMASNELTNALESFYVSLDSKPIEKYYTNKSKPEIIEYIIKLSEAVVFNDVLKMEDILKQVYENRENLKKIEKNSISNIIILTFVEDLIKEITQIYDESTGSIDTIKLINWCNDKKLLKQALTLIENKIPKKIIDKLNINFDVYLNGVNYHFGDAFNSRHDDLYDLIKYETTFEKRTKRGFKKFEIKDYESEDNNIFELIFNIQTDNGGKNKNYIDIINHVFKNYGTYNFESLIDDYYILNCDKDLLSKKSNIITHIQNLDSNLSVTSKTTLNSSISSLDNQQLSKLITLILGYYAFKEQRNKVNHFDERKTINFEKIEWLINLYMKELNVFLGNQETKDAEISTDTNNVVITNMSVLGSGAKETQYYEITENGDKEICRAKQQQIPGTIYYLKKHKHISNLFVVGSKKIFGNLKFNNINNISDIVKVLNEHRDDINAAPLEYFSAIKKEIEESKNELTIDKVIVINNSDNERTYPNIVIEELRKFTVNSIVNIYVDTQGYKRSFFNTFYNTIHTLRIFNKNIHIKETISINYNNGEKSAIETRTEDIMINELMNGISLLYTSNRTEIIENYLKELQSIENTIKYRSTINYLRRIVKLANNINSLSKSGINQIKDDLTKQKERDGSYFLLKDYFFQIRNSSNYIMHILKLFTIKIKNEYDIFLNNGNINDYEYACFMIKKKKYLEALTIIESGIEKYYYNRFNRTTISYTNNINNLRTIISNIENELSREIQIHGNDHRKVMDYFYFLYFSDYESRKMNYKKKWLQNLINIYNNNRNQPNELPSMLGTINIQNGNTTRVCTSYSDLLSISIRQIRHIFNHAKELDNQNNQIKFCKYFCELYLSMKGYYVR